MWRIKRGSKNLTIKCVQLMEQSRKLTAKVDGQQIQISRLTDKVMEQSNIIDRLQEKAFDLGAFGASFRQGTGTVDSGTVKGVRTGRKGKETPETCL